MSSTVIQKKGAAAILSPESIIVNINGEEIEIKPLPDKILITIAEAVERVVGTLRSISPTLGDKKADEITLNEIAPLLPALLKELIPNSTAIISAALRKEETWIADNVNLGRRAKLISAIFQAEDIPLLLGELSPLLQMLTPEAPAAGDPQSGGEPEQQGLASTEPPSIPKSPKPTRTKSAR